VHIAKTTMKIFKLLSFIICLLSVTHISSAQTTFWSDTFDPPAGGPNNNNAGSGWTLNPDGFGGNRWFINGSNTNCQGANMLHISCDDFLCSLIFGGPTAAIYNAGEAAERSAFSPAISTIGQSNIQLRFFWVSNGEPGDDFGTISFSADGGATWAEDLFTYAGVNSCQEAVIPVPAMYANIPNFMFKFNWVNSANNVGQDYPFNIDDIRLTADEAPLFSLTTGLIAPGPYCPGAQILVPFTTTGTFDPGNVFTAQLSNAGGSFAAPVNIGTLNGSTSGVITATIPPGTPVGANYLIRVTSSNPNIIATPSATLIEIAGGPTASIDPSSGNSACPGSGTTLLYNGSPGDLVWLSSTNGTTFTPIVGQTADILNTPAINQTTWFQVQVTNDCGNATSASWQVTLSNEVEIPLTSTPNSLNLCNGNVTVSVNGVFFGLEWSNGQIGGNAIIVSEPGTVFVTGQDPNGCPAASQELVFIETTPPALTTIPVAPITICGNSATVSASAGFANYVWSNGTVGPQTVVNTPGIITVNATDNNGCVVSSGPINIVTGSAVAVPVEPAVAAICDGVPATITAGAGFTGYTWSNGASGQAITVSNTGFYSVTATDDNGCPGSSALVEVISSQFPISNFSYTQNEGGYTINFENLSQNGLEYVWAFDSVGTSPLNNPSFTFPDYGPYTVTLIISNPCGSDTINKLVVVTPVGIDEISNGGNYVLSPNPTDNIAYIKKLSQENEQVNIQLFDASGRLLFKENNVQTSKSFSYALQTHELNAGVYLVLIQSKRENTLLKLVKK